MMTALADQLRKIFEALYPSPTGVFWRATQGCFCYDEDCDDTTEYIEYTKIWEGFQSGYAAALGAAPQATGEKS